MAGICQYGDILRYCILSCEAVLKVSFIFYVFIFPDEMTDVWDNIGEYCLNEMSPDMFMVLYVIL